MSTSAGINRMRNAITPECENLGKSIKVSALIVLIILIIVIILMVAAIVYNHMKQTVTDADRAEDEDKKKNKIIGGLSIGSVVVLAIGTLAGIWQYVVAAKVANVCLS